MSDKIATSSSSAAAGVKPGRRPSAISSLGIALTASLAVLASLLAFSGPPAGLVSLLPSLSSTSACPQPPVLHPTSPHLAQLEDIWATDAFKQQAVDWLSGAVQVRTESFSDMDELDERWAVFGEFHAYLARAFPEVHARLKRVQIGWSLVFEWTGSDTTLKPVLFAAHQDVVAATDDDWIHPPFSGHYDGEFIWGRGAVDDKSSLIGVMAAVESMLKAGFRPKRTILLAFGQDEEVGGALGAKRLALYLEKTYGHGGIALLLDEGGGYLNYKGTNIAAFGTSEKGLGNVRIAVKTAGGHASSPPSQHTSIGILSQLITHLENNPHSPTLTRENPLYSALTCGAHYVDLPWYLRALVKGSAFSDWLLWFVQGQLVKRSKALAGLIGTTQAVTLVSGGLAHNALPESAEANIHHRIDVSSSGAQLREHITSVLRPKAKALNLTLTAFSEEILTQAGVGHVVVETAHGSWSEPAPITSTAVDTKGWNVLVGSVKSTFETRAMTSAAEREKGQEMIATPALFPWNTDSRHYSNLSSQIYRFHMISFADMYSSSAKGIHGVNEALRASGLVNLARSFGNIILNVNEHDL